MFPVRRGSISSKLLMCGGGVRSNRHSLHAVDLSQLSQTTAVQIVYYLPAHSTGTRLTDCSLDHPQHLVCFLHTIIAICAAGFSVLSITTPIYFSDSVIVKFALPLYIKGMGCCNQMHHFLASPPQLASLWRSDGGSHHWTTGDVSAGSLADLRWQPPEEFVKLKIT